MLWTCHSKGFRVKDKTRTYYSFDAVEHIPTRDLHFHPLKVSDPTHSVWLLKFIKVNIFFFNLKVTSASRSRNTLEYNTLAKFQYESFKVSIWIF